MNSLVIGGASSGKSAYAESIAVARGVGHPVYYLATMRTDGEEARKRIANHRRMREGKGFLTIEADGHILDAADSIKPGSVVLLEDLCNLLANEMFFYHRENAADEIHRDIVTLSYDAKIKDFILVTDDIFCDGVVYDTMTDEYVHSLARLHRKLAKDMDEVIEVHCGIAVPVKGAF